MIVMVGYASACSTTSAALKWWVMRAPAQPPGGLCERLLSHLQAVCSTTNASKLNNIPEARLLPGALKQTTPQRRPQD